MLTFQKKFYRKIQQNSFKQIYDTTKYFQKTSHSSKSSFFNDLLVSPKESSNFSIDSLIHHFFLSQKIPYCVKIYSEARVFWYQMALFWLLTDPFPHVLGQKR